MQKNRRLLSLLILLCLSIPGKLSAQDTTSLYGRIFHFPDKLFGAIDRKSEEFQQKLVKQSIKYLNKLSRQEEKLKRKLFRKDSTAANRIFGGSDSIYLGLENKLKISIDNTEATKNVYNSHLDSLQTALKFLNNNKLLGESAHINQQIGGAFEQLNLIQSKLNQTEAIQKYLQDRQQYLTSQLSSYGFTNQLKSFKREVYYYRAQVDAYKRTFEDPTKVEAMMIGVLQKIPSFNEFFNKNSQLAGFFRLPGTNSMDLESIVGSQTRAQIQQELEQRIGGRPDLQEIAQGHVSETKSAINQIKDQVNKLRNNTIGNDINNPDFRPNTQRTKTLLERLEYGANLQSTKSNYFFPTTSDIGLSLGYKINDKNTVGVGASYRVGWGKDIQHINITHQGLGFRSFWDMNIKGGFWITGGAELNYRSQFDDFEILKNYTSWQKSALIGLTKKFKAGRKLKGNLQLLYDFLYREQIPTTQPLLFRIGYNF